MKRLILAVLAIVFVSSFFAVQTPTHAAPKASTGLTALVLASQLNIRDEPSIGDNILGTTNWGETLTVLGRNPAANWYKIVAPDGTTGWVSAFWVRLSKNVARRSLPIVQ
jgi:uncharacterized protein YgiM (DUF1202 family)